VDFPKRLGWLKSGRFLRLLSALTALAVLITIIYNAAAVDRVPPTYTIKVSSVSSTGQALTLTAIDVDFSKEVNQDTAERAFSITPDPGGTFHWQGLKMIWTPSTKLPPSTVFHVRMAAGVQDMAGNAQGGTSDLTFTTIGAPSVTAVSPANGQKSVPVDSPIQITFDRLMDTQKVLAGLSVEPSFDYAASWNGAVLKLTPSSPLSYGVEYKLAIGDPAVDTDGSRLADYTTIFTTVGIGLRATTLIPAPNVAGVSVRSQVAVVFDGPIDPASVNSAVRLTPPVSGSTKVVALANDTPAPASPSAAPSTSASVAPSAAPGPGSNVLVFTPDAPLAAHTTYAVTMNSTVRSADGRAATQQNWSFTTGDAATNALNQIAFISSRGGVANVWLMNPDGSNQREVTSELVPVSGFDVSGDGSTIAYGAGGVVKKMSISGDGLTTVTSGSNLEYAPTFTPDGTALVVGRRDVSGADLGYWLIPLISGTDAKQLTPDGAPGPGSTTLGGDGLTGKPGMSAWWPRAAFSQDGSSLLVVRGSDGVAELIDLKGGTAPRKLNIVGDARPVWATGDAAFYLAGTADSGATWFNWRVGANGTVASAGPAVGDMDTTGQRTLVLVVRSGDGYTHVAYSASAGGSITLLTSDPAFNDNSTSFSPDGSTVVFGRVASTDQTVSAGIWVVKSDGSSLTNLATDGAYPRWLP
jgi:hypothetical protein